MLMRTSREDLAFHEQHDEIVVFNRCNFLSYGNQSNARIIAFYILQDLTLRFAVNSGCEIVEPQDLRI